MKPEFGTPAYKAYHAGYESYYKGKCEQDNPYTTAKVIGLSNWWLIGFNDAYKVKLGLS